jgi:hypothetical protein
LRGVVRNRCTRFPAAALVAGGNSQVKKGVPDMVGLALFLVIVVMFAGFIVAMVRVTLAPRRIRRWYEDREADERKVAYVLYGRRSRQWPDGQGPHFGAEMGRPRTG